MCNFFYKTCIAVPVRLVPVECHHSLEAFHLCDNIDKLEVTPRFRSLIMILKAEQSMI